MDVQQIVTTIIAQARETPALEWAAILFAVAEVLLARYNSVWLYPAGIISTGIYTYLFTRPGTKLYADAILNTYYFVMSIYGWLLWSRRKNNGQALHITPNTRHNWLISISISIIGWAALYLLLTKGFPLLIAGYTPSDVAVWDAFISATAWAGMWLLAKRKVENWLLLNVSNLAAIPIYLYKGMPFTACLTLFLFIVAIFGYFEWKRSYRLQRATA